MASIRPLQCGQTLIFYATVPYTLPHNLFEELITSVAGDLPGVNTSQWFEELPKCTKTISILDTMFFSVPMGALGFFWVRGLGHRAGMFPNRRPCDKSRCTLAKFLIDAGFASAAIILTSVYRSAETSIGVVAIWAALFGGELPDAATMLLFFSLIHDKRMVADIGLTGAYASWAALWRDDRWRAIRELPSYEGFVANLRPVVEGSYQSDAVVVKEEHECLLCRCSDDVPKQLPCKRDHVVCIECLNRLRSSDKNECPFCCRPLFKPQGLPRNRLALNQLGIACLGATSAFEFTGFALRIYKGLYYYAAFDLLVVLPFVMGMWNCHTFMYLAPEGYRLGLWAVILVAITCCSGYLVGPFGEVTFVDGDLVGELEVWMGYSFFWGSWCECFCFGCVLLWDHGRSVEQCRAASSALQCLWYISAEQRR